MKKCIVENCPNKSRTHKMCIKYYARWRRFGHIELNKADPQWSLDQRLRKIGWVEDENGCWNWAGGYSGGYGIMSLSGIPERTHRVAYRAWIGDIPDGLLVRHSCDNRGCINPEHLLVGTYYDNVQDMIERGRAAWQQH